MSRDFSLTAISFSGEKETKSPFFLSPHRLGSVLDCLFSSEARLEISLGCDFPKKTNSLCSDSFFFWRKSHRPILTTTEKKKQKTAEKEDVLRKK